MAEPPRYGREKKKTGGGEEKIRGGQELNFKKKTPIERRL